MNYKEKYKNLPEEKLVEIYFTKDQYDDAAIKDLYEVLEERGITEVYIDENYEHVVIEKEQSLIDKIIDVPNKIKSILSDLIDPSQRLSGFDIAKLVAIYLVLLSIYNAYYSFLEFQLSTIFGYDDLALWEIVTWLSFLIPLTAGILLWNEHKAGWIISIFYLVNKLVLDLVIWLTKLYHYEVYFSVFGLSYTDLLIFILLVIIVILLYNKKVMKDLEARKDVILSVTFPILLYSAVQGYKLFNFATQSLNY